MNEQVHKRKIGDLNLLEVRGDPSQPTIVILHGFGADAFDLLPISEVYKGPTWIFPDAPLEIQLAPGYSGRAWFPIDMELLNQAIRENDFEAVSRAFPSEISQAKACVEELLKHLELPRSQLIIGGFSQGAVLAIETALSASDPCAGLLILSGTLIHAAQWNKNIAKHVSTPFFQSHGTYDPLLPIQKARELERLLIEGGLEGQLYAFEGGHEIPQMILLKLSAFLKAHLKSNNNDV